MTDLINRADAIEAVMAEGRNVYTSEYASAEWIIYEADAVEALSMLPSAEAVSRDDKLIDGLEMLRFFNQRAGRELWQTKPRDIQNTDIKDADEILGKAIDALSADAGWIPCSERLPECGVGLHYLVTLKDGHDFMDDVYEAFFDKYGWHLGDYELAYDDVIAWMPLPTPYKGGDDE